MVRVYIRIKMFKINSGRVLKTALVFVHVHFFVRVHLFARVSIFSCVPIFACVHFFARVSNFLCVSIFSCVSNFLRVSIFSRVFINYLWVLNHLCPGSILTYLKNMKLHVNFLKIHVKRCEIPRKVWKFLERCEFPRRCEKFDLELETWPWVWHWSLNLNLTAISWGDWGDAIYYLYRMLHQN